MGATGNAHGVIWLSLWKGNCNKYLYLCILIVICTERLFFLFCMRLYSFKFKSALIDDDQKDEKHLTKKGTHTKKQQLYTCGTGMIWSKIACKMFLSFCV